MEDLKK